MFLCATLALVCVVAMAIASPAPSAAEAELERRKGLTRMLQLYMQQHNSVVVTAESKDQLCQRTFVANRHFKVSCRALGNSFGALLSNLAFAVVTNRTIVVNGGGFRACDGHLDLQPWVLTMEVLISLLDSAGCPLNGAVDFRTRPPCGYSNLSHRLLTHDTLLNGVYYYAQTIYDPALPERVLVRSRLLSGSPYEDYGRLESYGLLAKNVISLSKDVHRHVNDILKATCEDRNSVRISIHLRHQSEDSVRRPEIDAPYDEIALGALEHIRNEHKDKACFVYMASDRSASLARIQSRAESIGCTSYAIDRDDVTPSASAGGEHGPWAIGLVQVADIWLLRHGDYFIGSPHSTFSHLIAGLLAAHAFRENASYNPLVWVFSSEVRTEFEPLARKQKCNSGELLQ